MNVHETLKRLFALTVQSTKPSPEPLPEPPPEPSSPEPTTPTLKRVTDPEAPVEIASYVYSKLLISPDGPIKSGADYRATAMTKEMPGWMQCALSAESVFKRSIDKMIIGNSDSWNGHALLYRPIISPDGEIYHAFTRYGSKSESGLGTADRSFTHSASIIFRGPWSPDLLPYATMRLFTKREHCKIPSPDVPAAIEARIQDRENRIGDMGATRVGNADIEIPSETTTLAEIKAELERFEPCLEEIPFGPQRAAFALAKKLTEKHLGQSSAFLPMAFNINPKTLKIHSALTESPDADRLSYEIDPQGLSDQSLAGLTNEELTKGLQAMPYVEYLPGGKKEERHLFLFDPTKISAIIAILGAAPAAELNFDAQ